jgi:hypothetical protein
MVRTYNMLGEGEKYIYRNFGQKTSSKHTSWNTETSIGGQLTLEKGKVFLVLSKQYAMKTYGGVDV